MKLIVTSLNSTILSNYSRQPGSGTVYRLSIIAPDYRLPNIVMGTIYEYALHSPFFSHTNVRVLGDRV